MMCVRTHTETHCNHKHTHTCTHKATDTQTLAQTHFTQKSTHTHTPPIQNKHTYKYLETLIKTNTYISTYTYTQLFINTQYTTVTARCSNAIATPSLMCTKSCNE